MQQPSQPWQAVLFDLDGTLLDTAPDFITAAQLLLQKRGHATAPEHLIRNAVSHGSKGIIEATFNLDEGHPELEILRQELVEIYYHHLHQKTRPFDGILPTLELLAAHNIPWGIVTNKPSRYTDAILERLPFELPPATVVCPDHVSKTKPDPEPILLACREVSAQPEKSVYVGDHLRDIQAGKAAGTTTIAALYGYIDEQEDPAHWQADYSIDHAQQLIDILFCQSAT